MYSSTQVSEVIPLPAGVDLSQSVAKTDNIVVITLCAITLTVVLTRTATQIYLKSRPQIEDWIMLLAMPLLAELFITNLIAAHYGLGKHVWDATVRDVVTMKKMLYISLIIYTVELSMIKISLLVFYRRVFGMNKLNWLATSLVLIWTMGSVIATLVASDPMSYFWNQIVDPSGGHYRYNFYHYYIGNAATNVVCDFFVIIVPIPTVWRLKMRVTQKIMISMVLLVGWFAFAASIVRIYYLTKLRGEGFVDITWTMAPVCLWSTIEPCISVIGACLPTMQPIVQWALRLEQKIYLWNQRSQKRPNSAMSSPNDENKRNIVRLFAHATTVEANPLPEGVAHELENYLGDFIRIQYEVQIETHPSS